MKRKSAAGRARASSLKKVARRVVRPRDLYYDKLETRDPEIRNQDQFKRLRRQLANAKAHTAHWRGLLRRIDPEAIKNPKDLAKIPLTRKSNLPASQGKEPPFAGLAALAPGLLAHIYQSPGPIYEPDAVIGDYWRFARALWAAGLRPGLLVHNTFSYHLTPAGMMVESGARAIGCPIIPAGIGNTESQLKAIAHLKPDFYAGTPSFLKILLENGAKAKLSTKSLRYGSVGGEALPTSLRRDLKSHGIEVLQNYGSADLGLVAYETAARDGMIVDEGVFVEIVRPGSGDPVPDGEVGEVVVTSFNPVYPLIRFATGDLSAILPGISPCGRTNLRIKGWMGRADQTTKVKGMFVHPSQIAEIVKRYKPIHRARLVVTSHNHLDRMELHCEVDKTDLDLKTKITESIQAICKLRGEVIFAAPGSLPNDGKVIADLRQYD